MPKVARQNYVADFEATTDPKDCRVWAWGLRSIEDINNNLIGRKIDDFMRVILSMNDNIYFHNLRYDGSFIVNYLLHKNFKYEKSRSPQPGSFQTMISATGIWYSIDITTGYKGKDRQHIKIMDSYKKLPFPVKKVAKAFGLPIEKGEIDYHTYRSPDHLLTEEEIKYLNLDTEIMARALNIQFETGLKKMTIGSDALGDFKTRLTSKKFEKLFPVLGELVDHDIRQAYRGGFTWNNPDTEGQIINGGMVYDVVSLYPSRMKFEMLPVGSPMFFQGKYKKDERHPLYIQKLKCEFTLKPDHIPTIQIKNNRFFKKTEYLRSSEGELIELSLTNVDLDLFFDHYDVYNIEYLGGYKFKQTTGLFDEYIDYWYEIKDNPKTAKSLKQLAKLMLNSLYGKFGKNPDVTSKIPVLSDGGYTRFILPVDENGNKIKEIDDPIYIPMACFITAYARNLTIRSAQLLYDRIIYCDTDSLHIRGTEVPKEIEHMIDPRKLGHWAHETTFVKAKYLRQKTYVDCYWSKRQSPKGKYYIKYLKTDIKCAGMPDAIKKNMTFDDFKIGYSADKGKLKPVQVNGGVVLVDTPFSLVG